MNNPKEAPGGAESDMDRYWREKRDAKEAKDAKQALGTIMENIKHLRQSKDTK